MTFRRLNGKTSPVLATLGPGVYPNTLQTNAHAGGCSHFSAGSLEKRPQTVQCRLSGLLLRHAPAQVRAAESPVPWGTLTVGYNSTGTRHEPPQPGRVPTEGAASSHGAPLPHSRSPTLRSPSLRFLCQKKKKSLGWGSGRPARFPSSPGLRCCCCWRRGRMGRPHPRTQQEPCCKRPWGDLQGQGGQGRSPDTPPGRAGAALRLLQTLPLRLATRLGKRKRPASRQSPPLRF